MQIKKYGLLHFIFKELPFSTYEDFCTSSIDYVNNELWGNLGVTVLLKNHKKKTNQNVLNTYVEELKYGNCCYK
jgi:hypothetical protein